MPASPRVTFFPVPMAAAARLRMRCRALTARPTAPSLSARAASAPRAADAGTGAPNKESLSSPAGRIGPVDKSPLDAAASASSNLRRATRTRSGSARRSAGSATQRPRSSSRSAEHCDRRAGPSTSAALATTELGRAGSPLPNEPSASSPSEPSPRARCCTKAAAPSLPTDSSLAWSTPCALLPPPLALARRAARAPACSKPASKSPADMPNPWAARRATASMPCADSPATVASLTASWMSLASASGAAPPSAAMSATDATCPEEPSRCSLAASFPALSRAR
mmetsp:Transcript_8888/g.34879  ORF Transcript_8888/g.34879 Transcript_8888/m.34879 type:complete len:282 (+) Transcript_8888:623-1468(+)